MSILKKRLKQSYDLLDIIRTVTEEWAQAELMTMALEIPESLPQVG